MSFRIRGVLPLAAVCLALAGSPALAAKPQPVPMGIPVRKTPTAIPSTASRTAVPSCQLGVLPPAVNAFGYIMPPDDEYYTLIDPSQCAECGGAGVLLNTAHISLYFTAACQIPVKVSVMPAMQVSPGCLAPNPFAEPICPTMEFTVNDGGKLNDCVEYSFSMPAQCCLVGPAFLMVRFDQGTCPNSRPAFCGPASCQHCTQYNYYPTASLPGDDLCTVLPPFNYYGIVSYVDVTCCGNTPTLPGTWGKLKTLYR